MNTDRRNLAEIREMQPGRGLFLNEAKTERVWATSEFPEIYLKNMAIYCSIKTYSQLQISHEKRFFDKNSLGRKISWEGPEPHKISTCAPTMLNYIVRISADTCRLHCSIFVCPCQMFDMPTKYFFSGESLFRRHRLRICTTLTAKNELCLCSHSRQRTRNAFPISADSRI